MSQSPEQDNKMLSYYLSRAIILLAMVFIGGIVWLFLAFILNGGAAGSSSNMTDEASAFTMIYMLVFAVVFGKVTKNLFSTPKK